MYKPVNYNYMWIFLSGGTMIGCPMFYLTPKIMCWLDKTSDRQMKSREPTSKKRSVDTKPFSI